MSIVNKKYKHIFIHNPKVAGTSMENITFVGGSSHQTLYGYMRDGANLDDYYKWMFVRNPYDRIVSSFTYYKKNRNHIQEYRWMLDSFETYIKNLDMLFNFELENFSESYFRKEFESIHIIPQHYFVCIDGENKADFIGKLENIDEAWNTVCSEIGQFANIGKTNASRTDNNYKDYFTDELIEIVNEKYKKDFELFGYEKL